MRIIPVLLFLLTTQVQAQDSSGSKKAEIIYGRRDGMALTMMMHTASTKSNGKAVISIVSGNWRSSYELLERFEEKDRIYLKAGYTVFEVIHGSQPRFTIPDEIEDVRRAVRFIRYHAKDYGIDPDRIGITGLSSGGHLALAVATADDNPVNNPGDAADKVSSRVQAVAVFYPPTDFLNYGQQGFNPAASQAMLAATGLAAAFDFKRWNDTTRTYVSITDPDARLKIAKQISPIYAVSPDDPPVLIIHGDADRLVPLQQSETIIKKFGEAKVPNNLIIKKGGSHGWRNSEVEEKNFVDWFDKYLK